MPLEIEVKFLDVDHADLRLRLAHLGAHCVGRWFEANVVFDDARRSLKAAGALLRLREKSGRVVLTLKCASAGQVTDTVKICDESETDVADAASMRLILAGLGFSPALRYEKVREKWLLLGCEVCLDALPFGDFLEIEGSEEDIAACSRTLGLHSDRASTATYHELNRQHRASCGLPPEESFIFDDAAKSRLLARRATDMSGPGPLDMAPESA